MSTDWKFDKLRDLRVLIVDDNSGDRQLYKLMLAEADPGTNYVFLEAESGKGALDIMSSEKPDCVLLDYLLPDLLGLEFLQELTGQQLSLGPPIIMLTGFGDEATAVKALQSGAQGYIPKRDLTGEMLLQAIEGAIRARKNLQNLEKTRQQMTSRNRELEGKHKQITAFYQKVLGRVQQPLSSLRDHMAQFVVQKPGAMDESLQKQLMSLRAECDRLVATLKNLMDNPMLDTGHLLVSTRPESLMEVISAAVNSFRAVADTAGVRLSVAIQAGLPEVPMDRYRIEQVVVNVLDNAIKFTPPQGRVLLSIDRLPESPQEITVSVSDTGKGIPAGQLESVFENRARKDPGGTEDEPGIGIGLYICREIIHAHRGRISIRSLPESGTCLTFTLPLESRQVPAEKVWERALQKKGNSQWGLCA